MSFSKPRAVVPGRYDSGFTWPRRHCLQSLRLGGSWSQGVRLVLRSASGIGSRDVKVRAAPAERAARSLDDATGKRGGKRRAVHGGNLRGGEGGNRSGDSAQCRLARFSLRAEGTTCVAPVAM